MMISRCIKLIICSAWATFIGPADQCAAQTTPQRLLLALSKNDHTLAIVDPVSLKVITRVPVGPDPHEVVASSDGQRAYVSNMGGGRYHEMNIIDLTSQRALANFDTGPLTGLHGLAFTGGKLWFTAEGAKSIGRYDPKTATVDWIMGTGQDRTHMIYVTPDEKQIYTTNVESGTVSILENLLIKPVASPTGNMPPGAQPHQEWVQTLVPVAKGSEGFDVSPDGRELWTAGADGGMISIIDISSRKVIVTIDAKVMGANRLKFTADGKQVLVSSLRTGDLVIFDGRTRKEIKRLTIGHGVAGILVDPDGSRAFVACTSDNYVAVVDLKMLEITGRVDVGGGPDGLAWAVRSR